MALQWMRCMKAIKLLSLWGANAIKKRFFKKSVISSLKRVINEIVLTFWGIIHAFLASKGVFGFLSSSLVNLAYDASMLLVTFFGFRGCLGAFSSVSVFLFFSTLLDWFCDDFVEILGSVSPSLRNGLGAFSSVSVVLFFSTLLDWFCDDFVEILDSVSPSLRNGLGAVSSVSVGLFFSTLLDWFCDDFVEILCSVSPAKLCDGLGAFSTVSAAFCISMLIDSLIAMTQAEVELWGSSH